jgi:glycosyltransferase involved in cell wall biosynthesis
LSIVGLIIKFLFPQKKVLLIVHGIEVWQKLPFLQKLFIRKTDKILSVSQFTKQKIVEHTPIDDSKFCWFPNTFDPYIKWPNHFVKNTSLLQKYGIDENSKILLTVSRLEFYEKYKGYDSVIRTLPALLAKFPNLVYVLIGKADEFEQKRISNLITELKVEKNVKLLGFVPDDALVNHYTMADVFVMPSQKEGFGIVFIEAVLCGLQVIAGNKDGSKEALLQGEVGILIDPDQIDELQNAIINCLENPLSTEQKIHRAGLINQHFNIEQFESRLKSILEIA